MKKVIIIILLSGILIFYCGYYSFNSEINHGNAEGEIRLSNLEDSGLDLMKKGIENKEDIEENTFNKTVSEDKEIVTVKAEMLREDKEIGCEDGQEDSQDDQKEGVIAELSLIDQIKEHSVKEGESLWEIAKIYGIDIDTIIGANDITNMNRIKPGAKIKILPVKGILYRINPGESLWEISRRFKLDLAEMVEINRLSDPDLIKPGKLLILPGAKPEFGYQERLQKRFIKPVIARISSPFGMRWGKMHEGVDYAVPVGTNIKAAMSGKIIYSGWVKGYGETIIIEHRKGLRTLYAHNSKLLVHSGQWVETGQFITKSGNTGRSTGPHLHFEIQINGKPVNPVNYLR